MEVVYVNDTAQAMFQRYAGDIKRDLSNFNAAAMVGRNMGMAQMLGLMGTPSYVVGRDLFPGVTPIPVLKKAVRAARKA